MPSEEGQTVMMRRNDRCATTLRLTPDMDLSMLLFDRRLACVGPVSRSSSAGREIMLIGSGAASTKKGRKQKMTSTSSIMTSSQKSCQCYDAYRSMRIPSISRDLPYGDQDSLSLQCRRQNVQLTSFYTPSATTPIRTQSIPSPNGFFPT